MELFILLVVLFTITISFIYIPMFLGMLHGTNCVVNNYRNKPVPNIGGIVFLPILLTSSGVLMLKGVLQYHEYIRFLFVISSIGIIGLLDDLIGDKHVKGLKNHALSFIRGKLTTGFMKAFTGSLIALIICLSIYEGLIDAILNFFVIVLFTNTLNLFDLRPGRSTKAFLFFSVLLIVFSLNEILRIMPLIIITTAAAVYLYYDLHEKCMLGDTGSNIFGITLGYYSSVLLNMDIKFILFVLMLFLNILSEKKSLTEIIRKNKLLSFFDNLGRG